MTGTLVCEEEVGMEEGLQVTSVKIDPAVAETGRQID